MLKENGSCTHLCPNMVSLVKYISCIPVESPTEGGEDIRPLSTAAPTSIHQLHHVVQSWKQHSVTTPATFIDLHSAINRVSYMKVIIIKFSLFAKPVT